MIIRSMIGVMHGDKCKAIYCHWDGYLSHNGRILFNHYDSEKANHLVSLGGITNLRETIGEKHPFSFIGIMSYYDYQDLYGKMTTFYGRDRGETGVDFKTFDTYKEMVEYGSDVGAEYYYIMKDGQWYYSNFDTSLTPITAYMFEEFVA